MKSIKTIEDMDSKYESIIDLPRPVPVGHRRMSLEKRAAQFAPFAALPGVDGLDK